MKTCLSILFSVFFSAPGGAQDSTLVRGQVTDSLTSRGIPFATVAIGKDSIIQKVVSDSLGHYRLQGIAPGIYDLTVSAVGYRMLTLEDITITGAPVTEAGLHLLSREAGVLPGVLVRSSAPLVTTSADGFSYNAENDIRSAGATAADLLARVPMLTVDQNGSPVLRGSANIKVFIDDKPSDIYGATVADALRQIPAEDIVRIEVTLYPSAKYDAEGTDGVINIITRKTRFNAVNGTLKTQVANRSQNFTPELKIRNGKWIMNFSNGVYADNGSTFSTLRREDISGNGTNLLEQDSRTNYRGSAYILGMNPMYLINDLHTISAGYRFRYNRNHGLRKTTGNYYQHDSLVDDFTREARTFSGFNLHTVNLGYNGRSRDRKYSLLALGFLQGGVDNYDLVQVRPGAMDYQERLRGNQVNNEFSVQGDYEQKINDKISWDGGAKSIFRKYQQENTYAVNDIVSDKFSRDADRSNQFDFARHIHSLYSNLAIRLGSWQVRVGGRFEQTQLQVEYRDTVLMVPDYANFIPSFLVSKDFGERHTLKWSYGRRITRPVAATNPGINYIDSFNIQAGNAYLQPEITDRYEVGYTMNGQQLFLIASLYYNRSHNGIDQMRLPLDHGVFLNTYQNIGRGDGTGLSLSLTWKWRQKLVLSSTINLRYSHLESKLLQQSNEGYQCGINMNFTYMMGKGYGIEARGYINSPEITLQGSGEVWRYYAATFSKKFKGDKLSASFRLENFLSPYIQYLEQTWRSPAFNQEQANGFQNRYFTLSVTWKFGKKEIKAPDVRQETGSDEQ